MRAEDGAGQGEIAGEEAGNPEHQHVGDAHVEEQFVAGGVGHPPPDGHQAGNVEQLKHDERDNRFLDVKQLEIHLLSRVNFITL